MITVKRRYTLDLDDMFRRMNKAFKDLQDMQGDFTDLGKAFPVDMEDKEDKFILKADMPGLKKEDINLKATDNEVAISAQSKEEVHEEKENFVRKERSSRTFSRRVSLPESVDTDSIKAKYENGVLRIELPKKEKKKKKEVEVE